MFIHPNQFSRLMYRYPQESFRISDKCKLSLIKMKQPPLLQGTELKRIFDYPEIAGFEWKCENLI